MKQIANLLRKVPANLRFPLIIILAFLGFFLSLNGISEGVVWQYVVGVPLFVGIALFLRYIIVNKEQL